uniref:Tctex1 domain-containing protein 1-B-like n=1 Tax=Ciona intestinalis TaxID=7719 RepID=F6V4V8_CIOIN|nr:tctex1 domain-containing protein 1-B-like [Ciona intestinalis]|eukprot:XP_002131536.1 tctex1 domain-containing protein 1-B-like [Ciona intestinalis]
MAEPRVHDVAQAKAAKLLKKRTGSVSSAHSGNEHPPKRQSGKSYAASVSTISHLDHHHDDDYLHLRPATQLENTYQLEPVDRFPVSSITKIMQEVMGDYLQNKPYEPEFCRKMTKVISDEVKLKVKELHVPRYKVVCIVHIGQLNNQGLRISSQCLWNDKYDTFAACEYTNSGIFAAACVYGVYFE